MPNTSEIESAHEIAANLAGTLDLLASLHATAATQNNGGEAQALAATFAMLHDYASRLAAILNLP